MHVAFKVGKHTAWAMAITVNVLTSVWLVVAAYGGIFDPLESTFGAIMAMTFPAAMIVNFLFLIVNILLFKRLAILNAVIFVVCAGPIFTYCPFNISFGTDRPEGDNQFSLITYNIYELRYYHDTYDGESPHRALSYLLERDADVVCLQEMNDISPLQRWRYNTEQYDSLLHRYPYKFRTPYGLALLSRYPVYRVDTKVENFKRGYESDFDCYRLSIQGHKLYIFNCHLQSIGLTPDDKALYRRLMSSTDIDTQEVNDVRRQLLGKLSNAFRLRAVQARELRANIDSIAGEGNNVIVCGDFNDIPGCFASRTVRGSDMTDAYSHAGFGPSITYYANRFYFRIDHIFYRGDLKCLDIQRDRVRSSDHYPLYAVFEWK